MFGFSLFTAWKSNTVQIVCLLCQIKSDACHNQSSILRPVDTHNITHSI